MGMATAPVAVAPKFRGVIQFTTKTLVARPHGGVPVTSEILKTADPDDAALADWKPTTPVTVSAFEIATGAMVKHWHDKLQGAQAALRGMKAGIWNPLPPVKKNSAADPKSVKES